MQTFCQTKLRIQMWDALTQSEQKKELSNVHFKHYSQCGFDKNDDGETCFIIWYGCEPGCEWIRDENESQQCFRMDLKTLVIEMGSFNQKPLSSELLQMICKQASRYY